jgi:hypothetical protein
VDMLLVEDFGALSLREDQVEEKSEADPSIEWDPVEELSEDEEYFGKRKVPKENESSP